MPPNLKLLSLLALTSTFVATAQEYTFNYHVGLDIPDQNPFGLADSRTVNVGPGLTISDINVSLTIDGVGFGGFNGDLYVTLQHQSGFSVLLNRPGARPGTPSGYSDSGLNVIIDDSVPGDIHSYRFVLFGDENIPISGALTGAWAPDGRNIDPDLVSPTTPRDSMLNSFNGLPIDGTWNLFVSDLSAGGTHQLESWSLDIQAIPEPSIGALSLVFGFLLFFKAALKKSRQAMFHKRK